MTAAAGLLGFGAVADGSLADEDVSGVYYEAVSEAASASEAPSAQAVLANTAADTGAASDTASPQGVIVASLADSVSAADSLSGAAIFPNAIDETNAVSDTLSVSAIFPNAVTDAGSASDAPSNVVAFNPSRSETAAAADTASSTATFANAHSEAGSANDTPSGLAVFQNAISDLSPANDNLSPSLVARTSQSETNAASDASTSTATFVASATETGSITEGTGVQVGVSVLESGIYVDLSDDSLLGFGAIGGGALAAYGGTFILTATDSFTVTGVYNSSVGEYGYAHETYNVSIGFSVTESLAIIDAITSEYGFNFSYVDTEILCVRNEPRLMRIVASWKTSAVPDEQDARAIPDYKPRAEHRKRAC